MTTNRLLSCPFCDHEAEEFSDTVVKCTYCSAVIIGKNGDGTIARLNWNTRAQSNKDTEHG